MAETLPDQLKILISNVNLQIPRENFFAIYNKWNPLKFTTQKKEIEKKIKDFRQLYCPEMNSKLYKRHKNIKFAQFYLELGSSLDIDEKVLKIQNHLILLLVKYLHAWDDLIDEKNIPVAVAKELVVPNLEGKKVRLILNKKITSKLSTIEIQQLHKFLSPHRQEELSLVNQLQIPIKRYIEVRNKHIQIIENYFNNEKMLVKIKATRNLVRKMLQEGNCDFYFYNTIFYLFVSSQEAQKLDVFLKNYLVIDLLLDHIVDLQEDLEHNAFNTLAWFYESNYGKYLNRTNFDKQLKEYGVYDLFLRIAKDFEKKALLILDTITNKKLYELLKYYLEGQMKGLSIFVEHNYFIDFSSKERQKLKASVLKPHPWYHS